MIDFQVKPCEDLGNWLTEEGYEQLQAAFVSDRLDSIPPLVRRLLKDCYICFYVSRDADLYR